MLFFPIPGNGRAWENEEENKNKKEIPDNKHSEDPGHIDSCSKIANTNKPQVVIPPRCGWI